MPFKLRKSLLLGIATSATQIEGGDKNNSWYEWTKNGDKTLDGSTPLNANSHWERYKEHIDLMSSLSIKTYRMSIEWSRIEPSEDNFNEENMLHYIDEIKYLKEKGIKVLLTLHHFANPIWFDNKGGFKNKKYAINRFSKYVRYVVSHLKGLVTDYVTINEPNVYAILTFFTGQWVQQEKSWSSTRKVLINMGLSHIEAYKIIHEIIEDANVGFANNITNLRPYRPNNIIDRIGTWFLDRRFNLAITDLMAYGKLTFPLGCSRRKGVYFDFLGINYYTTHLVRNFDEIYPLDGEFNDLGWWIEPSGLDEILQKYHKKYQKNIYITENGIADKNDSKRPKYIYEHLKVVSKYEFVDRYYHWSFMDNFEWKDGYTPRFGIVEYFYDTATYKPRKSAYFYQEIINNLGVTNELKDKYLGE